LEAELGELGGSCVQIARDCLVDQPSLSELFEHAGESEYQNARADIRVDQAAPLQLADWLQVPRDTRRP
jgi:hypothetical protein